MKKIIVIISVLILTVVFSINVMKISRNEMINLLENNQLNSSQNVKIIEKEVCASIESYTKETLKFRDIECSKIKLTGVEEWFYINWINLSESKDVVVFLEEKIFNVSTMDVQSILDNYSNKILEYVKDKNYKYEYIGKEENCIIFKVYNSNEEDKNYEEIKAWVDKSSGDVIKMEKYLNESDYTRPENPISILEFEYKYNEVKEEDIKEPLYEDYMDFTYTVLEEN